MAHEDLSIAYGRGFIPLALPGGAQATVIRKAVLSKLARHDDPAVAVIPEGPYVIPVADA